MIFIKKTIFVITLFLTCENFFSQVIDKDYSNIICKYQVDFSLDSTNVIGTKTELMTLLIGDHVSLYKADQKAISDSLAKAEIKSSIAAESQNVTINLSKIPRVHLQHEVFFKNDKIMVYDKIFRNVFSFEPDKEVIWTLINETKKIDDYICYKATGLYGKRKLEAWYTNTVPIPEGPYVFKGLPGLIISLNDVGRTYSFKLVYLKNEKREIVPISNALNITNEKFVKARQDAKDNAAINAQSLLHREMTKQERDLVKINIAKRNNYLD